MTYRSFGNLVARAGMVAAVLGSAVGCASSADAESTGTESAAATAACAITPYGLIGDYYHSGITASVFGCPLNEEHDVVEGRGRIQDFERGVISWSPNQGERFLVAAWKTSSGINFSFGPSNPFSYDIWLFNVRKDGADIGSDRECGPGAGGINPCNRTQGGIAVGMAGPGLYRMAVEGCDGSVSKTCNQGWSNPIYLRY